MVYPKCLTSPINLLFRGITLSALLASHAIAQSSVKGIVRDASGAAVAQSPLVLLNSSQTVQASATTDSKGEFQFEAIPVGDYVLVARRRGLVERRLLWLLMEVYEAKDSQAESTSS